jgi:magnesium-transporting ATPase (P-type)
MEDEMPSLSLDEKNNLYMKGVIPLVAIMIVFASYFVYRMNTSPFGSIFELLEFFLPFMLTGFLAFMLTVEVFYHRIVRRSFRFHARRFGTNAMLGCLFVASFFVVVMGLITLLSHYVGEKNSVLIAGVSWSMLVAAIAFKFQRFFRKNWKEP